MSHNLGLDMNKLPLVILNLYTGSFEVSWALAKYITNILILVLTGQLNDIKGIAVACSDGQGIAGEQRGKQITERRQSRSCAPCSTPSNASPLTGQHFGKMRHYWCYAWTKAQMDMPSCGFYCSPSRSAWYFFPTWLTAAPFDQDTCREQQCYMHGPTNTVHIFLFSTL